jgi:hypothetical protein
VHQAFAAISYNSAGSRYRWRAYRADGVEIDVEPTIRPQTVIRGFAAAPGINGRCTSTEQWRVDCLPADLVAPVTRA